jgi:hypothetical protein
MSYAVTRGIAVRAGTKIENEEWTEWPVASQRS